MNYFKQTKTHLVYREFKYKGFVVYFQPHRTFPGWKIKGHQMEPLKSLKLCKELVKGYKCVKRIKPNKADQN